jgi:tetratricopeptide (TPR) repeat protein
MKTRITLILAALFISVNVSFAQQDEECMNNLTIFTDFYKSKRYDEAYEPWMKVRTKCPKFNRAIYAYGEKILMHKIENSSGSERVAYIKDLEDLWNKALEYFPANYKLGEILADDVILEYDYRNDLGVTDKQLYDIADKAYKEDFSNFTNPKALYIYFSAIVDLYDAKQVPIQNVFDKYDDVTEKIENEIRNYSEELNKLVSKEESGQKLTSKEENYKKQYESYLEAYDKIATSVDGKLGILANCENLIPLYRKGFEDFKNDAVWLKRAVSRMYAKECTDDPLYVDLVKAYDAIAPSADTKYFVATVLLKQENEKEAENYMKQAFDLETDSYKKGKLAERIASSLKSRGQYAQARNYYRESLKLNPSNGRPYLAIAAMYAASANSCGDDAFNKRAVFWLAAEEARKAARVDGNLKSASAQSVANYEAKAPTRAEIFTKGNQGQTITIGCWIGAAVTVPNL